MLSKVVQNMTEEIMETKLEKNTMNTPWGRSEWVQTYTRGVKLTIAGHNYGFLVAKGFAEKHLSEQARNLGENCGGYLAFENELTNVINLELPFTRFENFDEKRILKTIREIFPEYQAPRNESLEKNLVEEDIENLPIREKLKRTFQANV
jgi:hypothetical protein